MVPKPIIARLGPSDVGCELSETPPQPIEPGCGRRMEDEREAARHVERAGVLEPYPPLEGNLVGLPGAEDDRADLVDHLVVVGEHEDVADPAVRSETPGVTHRTDHGLTAWLEEQRAAH